MQWTDKVAATLYRIRFLTRTFRSPTFRAFTRRERRLFASASLDGPAATARPARGSPRRRRSEQIRGMSEAVSMKKRPFVQGTSTRKQVIRRRRIHTGIAEKWGAQGQQNPAETVREEVRKPTLKIV